MLRIDKIGEDDATVTLKLEGRIVDRWVAILEHECSRILRGPTGLALDLAGVTFIDRGGLALLKRLRSHRVRLVNCSLFVQELLTWTQKP
ncbi:MAG: STAS domain-containing protein [candidate division NC10 bacterium]|nr:STAS domain-containing protein [candidate division NC10 bacterium]